MQGTPLGSVGADRGWLRWRIDQIAPPLRLPAAWDTNLDPNTVGLPGPQAIRPNKRACARRVAKQRRGPGVGRRRRQNSRSAV